MKERVVRLFAEMSMEGIVSSILSLAGAGGVACLVGEVVEMTLGYPLPLASCCALAFAFGVMASIGMRKVSRRNARIAVAKALGSLTAGQEAMLAVAVSENEVFSTPEPTSLCEHPKETLLTLCDKGLIRQMSDDTWFLEDSAHSAIERSEDVKKSLSDSYNEVYAELMEEE